MNHLRGLRAAACAAIVMVVIALIAIALAAPVHAVVAHVVTLAMLPFALPQNAFIVRGLKPATDAAGRTGAYVSLKNWRKAYACFLMDQGNAATVACDVLQASAIAGTGAKATPAVPIWSNLDIVTSDTLVERTAAASYTTDAALKEKWVVIEIDPSVLDVANGFDCIAMRTGASNAGNLTSGFYVLVGPRFAQATPPSAILD